MNAVVDVGTFTLSSMVVAGQIALESAAVSRVFTVSVDRVTRLVTIAADGVFDLLIDTGATKDSSILSIWGFTGAVDLTGSASYTGDSPMGLEYKPQFKLQGFVDKEDWIESSEASINVATDGSVEVVRFGEVKFYEMDIKFITSLEGIADGFLIKGNPTGHEDAIVFMKDITQRKPFEFMKDIDDKTTFDKVQLDKIPNSKNATGFKLKELFDQNLRDVFETGLLKLRVIE